MAYLGNKMVNQAEKCQIEACCEPGYYLKDEEFLLCKKHGQSKIDFILSKKIKTKEDRQYIQKYIKELSAIMQEIVLILPKKN